MMIAFMIGMNVFLKTSSDINSIQNATNKHGFNSTSKVSFDMFRFNALMNDFRSDTSERPELLSRQTAQSEKYSQRPEHINKKSSTFANNQDVHSQRYIKKSEQINSDQNDSETSRNIDKKEVIQNRDHVDGTSGQSNEQTEFTKGINDQCPDCTEKYPQQPEGDALAETGEDRGHHIGLFLSNILNSGPGELIIDNLIGEGNGSNVSEIAQSGNKSQSEIDLKTGNLLSHLLKGEIESGKTSGESGSQPGANGDGKPDDFISRINTIQSSKAEAGKEGKSADAVNSKLTVSESRLQAGTLKDILSENQAIESDAGFEENLKKVQAKAQTAVHGETGEAQEHVSGQPERKTDQAGRNSIELDRKADFKGNTIRQFQDTVMESGLKEIKNGDTIMVDKPLTHIPENYQMGTSSKISINSNARSEGISSETSNNSLMNNSSTSHESIKAGEGLKMVNTVRPSAFNEVVDRITYIIKSSTKMGVKVESETLGKLNINVSIEKGLVNIHINSADKAVREFVENNMQQIVDSLSKNGVSVGGFSVGLRNNNNNESDENINGNGREIPFSADRAKEREYMSTATSAIHNNGLVNIFA